MRRGDIFVHAVGGLLFLVLGAPQPICSAQDAAVLLGLREARPDGRSGGRGWAVARLQYRTLWFVPRSGRMALEATIPGIVIQQGGELWRVDVESGLWKKRRVSPETSCDEVGWEPSQEDEADLQFEALVMAPVAAMPKRPSPPTVDGGDVCHRGSPTFCWHTVVVSRVAESCVEVMRNTDGDCGGAYPISTFEPPPAEYFTVGQPDKSCAMKPPTGPKTLRQRLAGEAVLRSPAGGTIAVIRAAAREAPSNAATLRFFSSRDLSPISDALPLPPWNAGLPVSTEWVPLAAVDRVSDQIRTSTAERY